MANNFNGYWLETGQPRLTPNGANDAVLASAPVYQTGTLGSYYLPTSSPLYNAGSRFPGDAGLYHYTSRTDQVKDGEETTSPNKVNIGLHYVALVSNQPKDMDADGLPDYFEDKNGNNALDSDETSLSLSDTDSDGVADSREELYADADFDSDGLTTKAELFIATNPLSSDNPLLLNAVTMGEEPYTLAFSVPLATDVSANGGALTLTLDGQPVSGYEIERQLNGTYLVRWNSTFSPWGDHYLQLGLHLSGITLPRNVGQSPLNVVPGPFRPVQVKNIVQFKTFYSSFSDQLWVYGTLEVPQASYEIKIYDTQDNLVKTITGYTDTGVIEQAWDLTETPGGPQRQDAEFRAQVLITPPTCNQNVWHNCSIPYPLSFFRSLNWGGDTFTMAYGWDDLLWSGTRQQMIRENVVDVVFNPALNNEYQNTFLNTFHGQAFRMHSTTDQQVLLDDLAAYGVRNFFWCGHGSEKSFDAGCDQGCASINASDVSNALNNRYGRKGWQKQEHPYRLVIMNSCDGAKYDSFAKVFGIEPSTLTNADLDRRPEAEQAYVGWRGEIDLPTNVAGMVWYGPTLSVLFNNWMWGFPLDQCLQAASDPGLSFPLDQNYVIFGYPQMKRTRRNQP